MKKIIISVIFMFVFLVNIVACNKNKPDTGSSAAQQTTQTTQSTQPPNEEKTIT